MKPYWNEIQPIDSFMVKTNGVLHSYDQKVIDLLYQPLIGPISTSLYHTLWNKVLEQRTWSEEWNHYHLMNFFDLNLEEIFHARLKLEGMGLLKTYVKSDKDLRKYIYELQPPLSASEFFSDGMLNIYLYQKLGQSQFMKLKRFFTDKELDLQEYKEMTRSFQDVFTSLGKNSLSDPEAHQASKIAEDEEFIQRQPAFPIQISETEFDFNLFFSGISEFMIPKKAFTKSVREAIEKLSFLYSINAIDMQNLVLSSLSTDQEIDIEELRKAARDWYQMENDNQLPQLVDRKHPVLHRTTESEPKTKEEKLIAYLETVSPRQLLIDLADGGEPAISDLQAVEDVMFQQKLLPGVTNVLIHYVMLRTDMKLSRNYLTKIASHWSRKKIKTVREAMELAKSEHRQYQEWAKDKKAPVAKKSNPIRTEKLPDWFVNQDQKPVEEEFNQEQIELRKRLEAIQQKYRNKGGENDETNK